MFIRWPGSPESRIASRICSPSGGMVLLPLADIPVLGRRPWCFLLRLFGTVQLSALQPVPSERLL